MYFGAGTDACRCQEGVVCFPTSGRRPPMHLTPADWFFAFAPIVVQLLLLTTMVKRKFRTTFPILFNYVIANLVAQSSMAIVGPHLAPLQYFYAFWSITAVIMILGF